MMIDTHCHLFTEDYDNINDIIKKMGNNIMIVSAYNKETIKKVLELVDDYPNIYGSIGIHPEEINDMNQDSLDFLEKSLNNKKIVAIGEIGLDYHYTKENIDIEKEYFIKQLELARKYNKPVVIHSRDAAFDTLEILKNYKDLKIDMHCYGYSKELAMEFKKLNIKFGIGGVITFKNSTKLKEVVDFLDITDILLETDCPYLTPEPFRGKKNEPYNVYYVAEKLAEIKNISLKEVLEITTKNAVTMFDLK